MRYLYNVLKNNKRKVLVFMVFIMLAVSFLVGLFAKDMYSSLETIPDTSMTREVGVIVEVPVEVEVEREVIKTEYIYTNKNLIYSTTTDAPVNCRALIKTNYDGYITGVHSSSDALNSINRNCGEFGYSWEVDLTRNDLRIVQVTEENTGLNEQNTRLMIENLMLRAQSGDVEAIKLLQYYIQQAQQ